MRARETIELKNVSKMTDADAQVAAHNLEARAQNEDADVARWLRDIAKRLRGPRTRTEFADKYVAKLY